MTKFMFASLGAFGISEYLDWSERPGHAFYATPAQKRDAHIYGRYYADVGALNLPALAARDESASRDPASRNMLAQETYGATLRQGPRISYEGRLRTSIQE